MTIDVITANLTALALDAIVNAANPGLLGGGGVDGAIHRAAGRELLQARHAWPEVSPGVRCPTGEARITPGFALKARYVIHTVGPVWRDGRHGEPEQLASCYRACVALAIKHNLTSIGFPAISCGVYGYPPTEAARVAVTTLRDALAGYPALDVQLCGYHESMSSILRQALNAG